MPGPFLLLPIGSHVTRAGFRCLFAFWMGGGGDTSGFTPNVTDWLVRARRRGIR